MTDLAIRPLDPYDDAALRTWYAVYHAAEAAGREYHAARALEELRAIFRAEDSPVRQLAYAAYDGERVVGAATLMLPQRDNRQMGEAWVYVAPPDQRRGIGTALLAGVERIARADGRTTLTTLLGYPADLPADGAGWASVEFARAHGYTFGLGDLQRVLDLPVPAERIEALEATVADKHAGYEFRAYTGTPDDVLLELGRLRAAVMVEAPMGEIAREAGYVDEAVVRAEDAELAAAGRTRYGVLATAPDGSLAGYTEIAHPAYDPRWLYQWGTLVWPKHRGHGLGLAMKLRNIAQVQRACPDRAAVRTWNAEVNAPMVAVNEAMGYRVVERMGEFQKRLG